MSVKTTHSVENTINNLNYKLEKEKIRKIKKCSENDSNKSREVYLYLSYC